MIVILTIIEGLRDESLVFYTMVSSDDYSQVVNNIVGHVHEDTCSAVINYRLYLC